MEAMKKDKKKRNQENPRMNYVDTTTSDIPHQMTRLKYTQQLNEASEPNINLSNNAYLGGSSETIMSGDLYINPDLYNSRGDGGEYFTGGHSIVSNG